MASISRQFLDYVLDQLAPLGPISSRRLFSGAGLLCGETHFAMLIGDTLYLHADEAARLRMGAAGSQPFTYSTKLRQVVVNRYWSVPADVLDDPDVLIAWARESIRTAAARPVKKRKKKA